MSRAAIRLLSSITDLYRTTIEDGGPGFPMYRDALHAIAACPYPRGERFARRHPPTVLLLLLPRCWATSMQAGLWALSSSSSRQPSRFSTGIRTPSWQGRRETQGFSLATA